MAQEVRTDDLGNGNAVTYYDDGTWVSWDINTGEGRGEGNWDTGDAYASTSYDPGTTVGQIEQGEPPRGERDPEAGTRDGGPTRADQWDGPDNARYLKGTNPAEWYGPPNARVYRGNVYDTTQGGSPAGGGAPTGGGGGGAPVGGGGGGTSSDTAYASQLATTAALNAATQAAQQEYLKSKLKFEERQFDNLSAFQKEELSFKRAQEAFNQELQKAQLTGDFNGTPTWQKTVQEAGLTGYYNGQSTLAREQLAQSEAALTGYLNGKNTLARDTFDQRTGELLGFINGQNTLSRDELNARIGEMLGYYNGQNTLGRDELNQRTGLGVMQLAADLRGPKNAFQYAKVLNGTPQGMRDIVSAAFGSYKLPGSGGGDPYAPQEAASVQGLYSDVLHGVQVPSYGAPAQVTPPGVNAPTNQYNYEPTGNGSYNVYPPGVQAPAQRGQYSTMTPMDPHAANSAAHTQANAALPMPNQWNASNINNMGQYQKDLLLAAYEAQGYDPTSAWETFKQSLPDYGGPKKGTLAVPLA
jgi:hypothetical protein